MRLYLPITVLILVLATSVVVFARSQTSKQDLNLASVAVNILPVLEDSKPVPQGDHSLIEPVENFLARITKKDFGMYITPETSPIENDRFTGYHTGVDAEFSDIVGDVPVRAIADGTIISQTWTSGYGGVIVILHVIDGVPTFALYGHLNAASFVTDATQVKAGDIIAVLGDDHSQETDGVRKHLHFGLYRGEKMDYRGYVPTEVELKPWLNPLYFF